MLIQESITLSKSPLRKDNVINLEQSRVQELNAYNETR